MSANANANQVIIGVDLSYSINKKSYNLIPSSTFHDFCASTLNIPSGAASVHKVISFGADRYGVIHTKNESSTTSTKKQNKSGAITGFICNKNAYTVINESVEKALHRIEDLSGLIFCNTASGQQIIMFNNNTNQFKSIELFDKQEQAQIKQANNYKSNIENEQKEDVKQAENDIENDENEKKEEKIKVKKKRKSNRSRSSTPTFKVKSSIKGVFKHLLLTANGSLYGLQRSFHKKYVNNQRVTAVKCDGNRCTLCLDENGVLWSFGVNLFGKLGLKRNDKKQVYTNPREISIFKAYKVSDFGITNRCCMAVCANGSIYGWGSYRKTGKQGGDIWYTPYLLTVDDDEDDYSVSYDYDQKAREKFALKQVYRVYAGYRFIMLLNVSGNKLYCLNTEFGYTLMEKGVCSNGLVVQSEEIEFEDDVVVKDVVPSNESAMIIGEKHDI